MNRVGLIPAALTVAALPQAAWAQVARTADPQGSGPIVAALAWLQGTLLGNVATAVAVMAVAAVGFMMLTGRLNWRFGATVIVGCFILFGAATIVSGIRAAAGEADDGTPSGAGIQGADAAADVRWGHVFLFRAQRRGHRRGLPDHTQFLCSHHRADRACARL